MTTFLFNRRQALQTLGALAAATAGFGMTGYAQQPVQKEKRVRFSKGTELAKTKVPANATDCHHHLYDSNFPMLPTATLRPADAWVCDYRMLQQRIGTTRNVIIQPSTYGVDNRLLVKSIAEFGLKNCRAVCMIDADVSDAELKRLHEVGVRGFRFNMFPAGSTTLEMLPLLAKRVAPMGWHLQVNAEAKDLITAKSTWSNLSVPVVFDHLGRLPVPNGMSHPTFAMVCELLQQGKAYVKLSAFYNYSKPPYSDNVQVASVYAKEFPARCVWGSDWPHPTEGYDNKPDDALLLDLLAVAVPDEAARNRILVDNPKRLYQFD